MAIDLDKFFSAAPDAKSATQPLVADRLDKSYAKESGLSEIVARSEDERAADQAFNALPDVQADLRREYARAKTPQQKDALFKEMQRQGLEPGYVQPDRPDDAKKEYSDAFHRQIESRVQALKEANTPKQFYASAEPSYASTDPFDKSSDLQALSDESPISTSLKRGLNQMTDSVGNAIDIASGNDDGIIKRLQDSEKFDRENPAPTANKQWMEDWKSGNTSAWLTNPAGFFGNNFEQLANSAPSMIGSIPGAIAGAAAGTSVAPGIGTVIGGVIGGAIGSAPGSVATEMGSRIPEMARKDGVNVSDPVAFKDWLSANRSKIIGEGTTKGLTVAAADGIFQGIGLRLLSGPAMAFQKAEAKVLSGMGVSATDKIALDAARNTVAYKAAMAAPAAELKAATTVAKNAIRGAVSFVGESAGEFTGEYYGEKLATGEGNFDDALLEALMAGGQSAVTTAASFASRGVIGDKAGKAQRSYLDELASFTPTPKDSPLTGAANLSELSATQTTEIPRPDALVAGMQKRDELTQKANLLTDMLSRTSKDSPDYAQIAERLASVTAMRDELHAKISGTIGTNGAGAQSRIAEIRSLLESGKYEDSLREEGLRKQAGQSATNIASQLSDEEGSEYVGDDVIQQQYKEQQELQALINEEKKRQEESLRSSWLSQHIDKATKGNSSGFAQMVEYEKFLKDQISDIAQLRAEASVRNDANKAEEAHKKELELARIADTIEGNQKIETAKKREALLGDVLAKLQPDQNPMRAFDKALRVSGFSDTTFTDAEKAKIAKWKELGGTLAETQSNDPLADANEMDAAELGIKEKQPKQDQSPSGRKLQQVDEMMAAGYVRRGDKMVGPNGQIIKLAPAQIARAKRNEGINAKSSSVSSNGSPVQGSDAIGSGTDGVAVSEGNQPEQSGNAGEPASTAAPVESVQPTATVEPTGESDAALRPVAKDQPSVSKYSVSTEDDGNVPVKLIRHSDGVVAIQDERDGRIVTYNSEFSNGKADSDLIKYTFEPLGYVSHSDQESEVQKQGAEDQPKPKRSLDALKRKYKGGKATEVKALEGKISDESLLNHPPISIIDVPAEEFLGKTPGEMREIAIKKIAEAFARHGGFVINVPSGVVITTKNQGIRHAVNLGEKHHPFTPTFAMSEVVDSVLESAVLADGYRSKKTTEEYMTIYRMYGAVRFDGKLYRAKLTLKQSADDEKSDRGAWFYDNSLTEIEEITPVGQMSQPEVVVNKPEAKHSLGDGGSISVRELLNGVKRDSDGTTFMLTLPKTAVNGESKQETDTGEEYDPVAEAKKRLEMAMRAVEDSGRGMPPVGYTGATYKAKQILEDAQRAREQQSSDVPSAQTETAPVQAEASTQSSDFERGQAMLGEGIDKLIGILGGKTNMLPEEEAQIIPVMSQIFRGAALMGYSKFKDAARFVMDTIRGKSSDVADKIEMKNLQAAYVNLNGFGADPDIGAFNSIDELFAERDELNAKIEAAEKTTDTNPSDAAKEAGNYRKGKFNWNGMTISIETPKGTERSGVGEDGKKWNITAPTSYGYFLGTTAADNEHLDVYVGPNPESDKVFVIDQNKVDSDRFDEHKTLIGFNSEEEAKAAYFGSFESGFAPRVFGAMNGPYSVGEFKDLLPKMEKAKPLTKPESLPAGWTGRVGGIATNQDPVSGGIIDKELVSGKWFVIPQDDSIAQMDGFDTQKEAFDALSSAVAEAESKRKYAETVAKTKEKEAQRSLIPLDQITITIKAKEAETGRVVEYDEKADVALNEIDDQMNLARRLIECLAS